MIRVRGLKNLVVVVGVSSRPNCLLEFFDLEISKFIETYRHRTTTPNMGLTRDSVPYSQKFFLDMIAEVLFYACANDIAM